MSSSRIRAGPLRTARTSSGHMPRRADVGTAVIADTAQHARLQIVVSDLVGQTAQVQHRCVGNPGLSNTPDLAESEVALVRQRHPLVMEREVFDRPRTSPMIPPIVGVVKPLRLVAEAATHTRCRGPGTLSAGNS